MKRLIAILLCTWASLINARVIVNWCNEFQLPSIDGARENPGVARAYGGESNGKVLLAGGANFPAVPLKEGGKKKYHADVYGFDVSATSAKWQIVGQLSERWVKALP